MDSVFGQPNSLERLRETFSVNPEITNFLEVVHEETERRRATLLSVDPSAEVWIFHKQWFDYITDSEVLREIGRRLKVSQVDVLSICIDNFQLLNWETLFWMRAYLTASGEQGEVRKISALREKEAAKQARIETATKGAKAKLASDPKQGAKVTVRECWDAWKSKPERYSSNGEFALDMLTKFDALKHQTTIMRWCLTWEREATR